MFEFTFPGEDAIDWKEDGWAERRVLTKMGVVGICKSLHLSGGDGGGGLINGNE